MLLPVWRLLGISFWILDIVDVVHPAAKNVVSVPSDHSFHESLQCSRSVRKQARLHLHGPHLQAAGTDIPSGQTHREAVVRDTTPQWHSWFTAGTIPTIGIGNVQGLFKMTHQYILDIVCVQTDMDVSTYI